jgi:hypothetical protein
MSPAITPQPSGRSHGQCQATRVFVKARCDAPTDYATGSFEQSRWLSIHRGSCSPAPIAGRSLEEVL